MLTIGIIFFILGFAALGFSLWFPIKQHKINSEIDKENNALKKKNEELKLELVRLGERAAERWGELAKITEQERIIISKIESQNEEVQKAFELYCDALDISYEIKEKEYDSRIKNLNANYERQNEINLKAAKNALEKYMDTLEDYYKETEDGFDKAIAAMQQEINIHNNELEKIKATYSAIKEAQKREEEMLLQSDFYSLHLTTLESDTITLIEEIKPRLPEPRVLCMLIWTTFYQKQMTQLCNDVLGTSAVCGIYKITNKNNGMCYIGQAVNIADRWKQHAKCGLGIDTPVQNKLYRAMLKEGIVNFTFELLEACPREQLNEKEKYYIDLYQAYDYGYNSTGGNK